MFANPRYEKVYTERQRSAPILTECRALVEEMCNLRDTYTHDEAKSLPGIDQARELAEHARSYAKQVRQFITQRRPTAQEQVELDKWLTIMPEELRTVWRRGMQRYLRRLEESATQLIKRMKKQQIKLDKGEYRTIEQEVHAQVDASDQLAHDAEFEQEDLGTPSKGNIRDELQRYEDKWLDPLHSALTEMRGANRSADHSPAPVSINVNRDLNMSDGDMHHHVTTGETQNSSFIPAIVTVISGLIVAFLVYWFGWN